MYSLLPSGNGYCPFEQFPPLLLSAESNQRLGALTGHTREWGITMYAPPTIVETPPGHSTVRQLSRGLLWRLVIVVRWTRCLFVCLLLQYRRNFVSGTDLQIGLGNSDLPQNGFVLTSTPCDSSLLLSTCQTPAVHSNIESTYLRIWSLICCQISWSCLCLQCPLR